MVELVTVNGSTRSFTADTIVVATGSRPRIPDNIPVDHEHILDSDSILSLIYLPKSLTVLGGGVIASEYASIFAQFGVQVTMIDQSDRPVRFLDPELTARFLQAFDQHGGRYHGQQKIVGAKWDGLSKVQQAQIEMACGDNFREGLAEGEAIQGKALATLKSKGVTIHRWSPEVLAELSKAWDEVAGELSGSNANFKKVWASFQTFRAEYQIWNDLGYL